MAFSSSAARPLVSPTAARLALLLLTALNFLNYIDRSILFAVQPQIAAEFHFTDRQIGLLTSAFFFCYMCFAPFAGFLADRVARKYIMARRGDHLERRHAADRGHAQLQRAADPPHHCWDRRGDVRHHHSGVCLRPLSRASSRPHHGGVLRRHPGRHGDRLLARRGARSRVRMARAVLCMCCAGRSAGLAAVARAGAATRRARHDPADATSAPRSRACARTARSGRAALAWR